MVPHDFLTSWTGLEPITDSTFETMFRSLRDEVQTWCRKVYGPKTLRITEGANEQVGALGRVVQLQRAPRKFFAEMVIWGFIEGRIMSLWFPGFGGEAIDTLEAAVHKSGSLLSHRSQVIANAANVHSL